MFHCLPRALLPSDGYFGLAVRAAGNPLPDARLDQFSRMSWPREMAIKNSLARYRLSACAYSRSLAVKLSRAENYPAKGLASLAGGATDLLLRPLLLLRILYQQR